MRPIHVAAIPHRAVCALLVAVALLLAAPLVAAASDGRSAAPAGGDGGLLVYHQITDLVEESGAIASPVLSADGRRAAFGYRIDDPDNGTYGWHRIYVVNADGSGLTKIDDYEARRFTSPMIDSSADGATIVWSDTVQIRIADRVPHPEGTRRGARELVALENGVVETVRISGDGRTVFFVVYSDDSTIDGEEVARGVWAIDADGGNLRQLVGAEDVAAALSLPIEATWPPGFEDVHACCFVKSFGEHSLDVSEDGGRIVFHTHALDQAYLFTVDGSGGDLRLLLGPTDWVHRVAISGEGGTVAYQAVPTGAEYPYTEVGVVEATGGEPRELATGEYWSDGSLELSGGGEKLLFGPAGLLIDTVTAEPRQLAVITPGAYQGVLLTDRQARATMNADATRFLYVVEGPERNQLATLDTFSVDAEFDLGALGAAPLIADPTIVPAEILFDGDPEATASASAAVEFAGTLRFIGVVALRDGVHDENIRAWDNGNGAGLYDDGTGADAAAGDGIYTSPGIFHYPYETREDDTGPRTVRFQVEVLGDDGLLHGTAIDLPGVLTVVAG